MANNNRRRGNGWELETMHIVREVYPDAVTSRNESRARDAMKVDLCNTGDINFQCKSINGRAPYEKILEEMPDEGRLNVILHKMTVKKGSRFYTHGKYAILSIEDLMTLIKLAYGDTSVNPDQESEEESVDTR